MYQQFLSQDNISLLKIEQAVSHLKAGLPILLDDIIIFSAETVNHKILHKLGANLSIIIPDYRLNFLFDSQIINKVSIAYPADDQKLARLLHASDKLNKADYHFNDLKKNYHAGFELLRIAGLLPAIIILDNPQPNNINININSLDIVNYRKYSSSSLEEIVRTDLVLKNAKEAKLVMFRSNFSNLEHYALIIGNKGNIKHNPLTRIHSSCFTGDLLSSLHCDCGDQFNNSIKYIAENEGGLILYLMQEGRSIGLANKMRSYNLQKLDYDTVEANKILGFKPDERDFFAASVMLKKLNIAKIKLLSNNPKKAKELEEHQIEVSEIIHHDANVNPHNICYLRTKSEKMGHKINSKLF
jgi:GTP cyclohydrolase II